MPKKVLILNTSPRKKGNSHLLAQALATGAQEAGYGVDVLELGTAHIGPCLACGHCRRQPGQCVQADDMTQVRAAIEAADLLVFAGPLYYFGLPAQMKLIIDRLYAYGGSAYPKRDCLLLMTCADDDARYFAAAELNYQMALLDYVGWQDRGRLLVHGVNEAGAIAGHPALQTAYEMGKAL